MKGFLKVLLLLILTAIGRLLIFLMNWFGPRTSAPAMAATILEVCKKTWDRPQQVVPADPGDFPHLAGAFYDSAQAELEAVGFRFINNTQIASLADVSPDAPPTYIRNMLSANGEVSAGIYQFTYNDPSEQVARSVFMVEFETELTDGTFILTGPITEEDKTGEVPGIIRVRPPFELTNAERYEYHERQVMSYCEDKPGVRPVVMTTAEDLLASGARSHEVKRKYRESIGWLTREELFAMSDDDDSEMTEQIWQEIQKLNGRSSRP